MEQEVLKIDQVLSEDVLDVLEKNDVTYGKIEEGSDTQWTLEIAFYTPKGGDEVHCIWFNKELPGEACDSEFCYGLEQEYENFDIDEYVMMWLEAKRSRKNICPLGAVELVEEAQWIEEFLYQLYKQVEKLLEKD